MHAWFWQLQGSGHGPDWFFFATVPPSAADRLATLIRHHPLPGFAGYQCVDGPCTRYRQGRSYDIYIDQHNYADLVKVLLGQPSRNLWVYHTIEVCGNTLSVERGYGGYPESHGETETSLIAMVAAADLDLVAWRVGYGGDGYAFREVASGTSAATLRTYLGAP